MAGPVLGIFGKIRDVSTGQFLAKGNHVLGTAALDTGQFHYVFYLKKGKIADNGHAIALRLAKFNSRRLWTSF